MVNASLLAAYKTHVVFPSHDGGGGGGGRAEALELCRRAADLGDASAELLLGLWLRDGLCSVTLNPSSGGASVASGVASLVKKNELEAVKRFSSAASKGLAEAQFALAQCCFEGRGTSKSMPEALR